MGEQFSTARKLGLLSDDTYGALKEIGDIACDATYELMIDKELSSRSDNLLAHADKAMRNLYGGWSLGTNKAGRRRMEKYDLQFIPEGGWKAFGDKDWSSITEWAIDRNEKMLKQQGYDLGVRKPPE